MRIQTEDRAGGHRSAVRSGEPGGVKTQLFAAVPGRISNAEQHFTACNESGQQRLPVGSDFLRKRERGRKQRSARMHAGARFAQAVLLEGMRERAVGKRGQGRLRLRPRHAKQRATAAGAVLQRIFRNCAAPRKA